MDAPDEWISRSLAWVDDMLERFKPTLPEHPVRRAALIRLDDILHIESAPRKQIIQTYYRARMERALQDIERTEVHEGARIWKLYNHGFLVRTPSASYCYDIVPGPPRNDEFRVAPEWIKRFVKQSDALMISHLHSDHASQEVAAAFLQADKAVVCPDGLWAETQALASRLTYARDKTVEEGKLRVTSFPGHQGTSILNNVHMVTSDEFTTMQTGDQSNLEDFSFLGQIGGKHKVDVLMPNCWTPDLQRMMRGVNPRFVMTGHENELAHVVPHREDYTQTWQHAFGSQYPLFVLTWGESYAFAPAPALHKERTL
jgi:L-ascorbate metabolism protein UlaG (beta-lactamase superfamily)